MVLALIPMIPFILLAFGVYKTFFKGRGRK